MYGLKFALRTLTKTPFVTAVAVVSLALGIGANTAIFSLFDQVLLQSLPVEDPRELVNLSAPGPKPGSQSCSSAGNCEVVFSYPMFRDLEREVESFSGIAAHVQFAANMAYAGQTTNGNGLEVSGSYFSVLGLEPALGRLLGPADDETIGAHFVAVLSHRYWENQLGADRSVLNGTMVINGQPMTVVGVAPPGFDGTTLGSRVDVFVPLTMRAVMNTQWEGFENRRSYWAYLFARLGPGVSMEQADVEVNSVYSAIVNDVEVPLQGSMTEQSMEQFKAKRVLLEAGSRGQSSFLEDANTPLRLLLGITGIVLLIACANIANLLLARGASRAQEMAIRGSLGASRRQMLQQLLNESVLLAVLGGGLSLLIAYWTLQLLGLGLPAEALDSVELALSGRTILFTAALSVVTGLVFGMYPAVHSTRPDLSTMLKTNLGQPAGARAAQRFRSHLVTAQIALSMSLLVAAGLFIKSLMNVNQIELGLDPENIVAFRVSPRLNGYEPERSAELFVRVEEELAALPGVTAVTGATVPLLSGNNWGSDVSVEGFEWSPGVDANARFNIVGPGYFSTMGMPLLAGREFTPSDADGAPLVAIVNETFARKFGLDGAQAVGKWMSTDGHGETELDVQIVGVVQDAKYSSVKGDIPPLFFTPYRQDTSLGSLTFYARTALEPEQIMPSIGPMVRTLDASLPVEDMITLEQQAEEDISGDRIIGVLSAAFAVLATILAAVGLYGVLAYTVAQRTREIGLRMALGAGRDSVRALVLKQVVRMVALGGVVGLVVALALGRSAQSLLFGVEGYDGAILAIVAGLIAVVALGASYIPALRASRVDPMQALRYE